MATTEHGVRVMRVQTEPLGPVLVIGEDEKDMLWEYCEDWRGKLYIEFTTMAQSEIDALPEFEGF
jgi:hypothetical protein